jgi:death on curing protein
MRYPTLSEVLELHYRLVERSGGAHGLRDLGALQSALAQPRMTFGGTELYATIEDKAAALCYSLVQNHPFIDGNKRIGHATMEVLLILNGFELRAPIDEAERLILSVASGTSSREALAQWIQSHLIARR